MESSMTKGKKLLEVPVGCRATHSMACAGVAWKSRAEKAEAERDRLRKDAGKMAEYLDEALCSEGDVFGRLHNDVTDMIARYSKRSNGSQMKGD